MRVAVFYDMAPGALAKLKDHFPAHRARLDAFHARGVPIGAGPLVKARWCATGLLCAGGVD